MKMRAVGGLIGLGVVGMVSAVEAYRLIVRPWQRQWGASDDEAHRALPGDERIVHPDITWTRAITTRATAAEVWPWLVQIGQGRGGYYSYPWLEWLMGVKTSCANVVNPALGGLRVGDVIPAEPGGSDYRVLALEPARSLVLGSQPQARTSAWSLARLYPAFTWVFALDEQADGQTRLIMRMRSRASQAPLAALATPIVDVGAFFIKRKMLLGIKQRAERTSARTPANGRPGLAGSVSRS